MKAEAYALLTAVVWGLAPVVEKYGLRGVDPFTATVVRSCAALAFILTVYAFVGHARVSGTRYLLYMILGGILGGGIGMYLYYLALSAGSASRVVPLSSTYPLFATLFSILALGERPSVTTLIGCALIVVGAVLVGRE